MTTPTTPPPSDAALDVAAVAAEAQRLLDAATPGPWEAVGTSVVAESVSAFEWEVSIGGRAAFRRADAALIAAAPTLARHLVALAARVTAAEAAAARLSDALATEQESHDLRREFTRGRDDGMRARHAATPFAEEPDATPPPPDGCGDSWRAGWRRGWEEMAAVVERDALRAERDASQAAHAALAGAVGEERAAREECEGTRGDFSLMGEDYDIAVEAAERRHREAVDRLDALLRGAPGGYVRASAVAEYVRAVDVLAATRADDTTPEMRGDLTTKRTALDAALAAVKETP